MSSETSMAPEPVRNLTEADTMQLTRLSVVYLLGHDEIYFSCPVLFFMRERGLAAHKAFKENPDSLTIKKLKVPGAPAPAQPKKGCGACGGGTSPSSGSLLVDRAVQEFAIMLGALYDAGFREQLDAIYEFIAGRMQKRPRSLLAQVTPASGSPFTLDLGPTVSWDARKIVAHTVAAPEEPTPPKEKDSHADMRGADSSSGPGSGEDVTTSVASPTAGVAAGDDSDQSDGYAG